MRGTPLLLLSLVALTAACGAPPPPEVPAPKPAVPSAPEEAPPPSPEPASTAAPAPEEPPAWQLGEWAHVRKDGVAYDGPEGEPVMRVTTGERYLVRERTSGWARIDSGFDGV